MRIVLINPPFTGIYGRYKSAARLAAVYPPLGLTYLASTVRDHDVRILDMETERMEIPDVLEKIKKFKPDVVGVTSTTPVYQNVVEILKRIKQYDGSIITLCGGSHITSLPDETLNLCEDIDIGVIGEGEITFREIIDCVESGEDYSNVEGTSIRSGNIVRLNKNRKLIENLDGIRFPSRDLLDYKKYLWSVPHKGFVPITTIMTSRGCPFKCIFCSQRVIFGETVRYRSVDNVIKELKLAVEEQNIKHFIFLDDTLGLNKKLTYELCDRIIKEGLDITWEGTTRADVATKELLKKMSDAGLNRISFGVESGNQHILDAAKKGTRLEQIRMAYENATTVGLETRMSIVLGLPFETKETIERTIKFMKSLKCQQAYVNVGTPFPKTEYCYMAKNGYGGLRLLTDDWSEYRRWGNAVIDVNDLSKEDLIKFQKKAMIEFYLQPRRILYNLKRAGIKAAIKNSIKFVESFFISS
ncbi:MAG: radical SAM protein [Candidatus Altiarchaeota archaeon]